MCCILVFGMRLWAKAEAVLSATYTHSRNLASFVLTYKALMLLLREVDGSKLRQHHTFIAAFIGGFVIFGRYNKVNEQVSCSLISTSL